jgi:hypothetical protein
VTALGGYLVDKYFIIGMEIMDMTLEQMVLISSPVSALAWLITAFVQIHIHFCTLTGQEEKFNLFHQMIHGQIYLHSFIKFIIMTSNHLT